MIVRATQFWQNNHFFRSSSLLFIVNIAIAFFNNIIALLASRTLGDTYSLWTALTGIVVIMSTPTSGISTEIVKNSAILSKSSLSTAYGYYQFYKNFFLKLVAGGVLLSPLIGYMCILILGLEFSVEHWVLTTMVAFYSIFSVFASLNNAFLLGILHIKEYISSALINAGGRFLITVVLLFVGLQVFALPIGLLSAILGAYLLTELLFIGRIKHATDVNLFESVSIKKELVGVSKTTGALTLSSLFLYLSSILAQNFLPSHEANIFAVLFTFGQIIHFGSISFLSALVAHSARGKDKNLYLISFSSVIGLTVAFTLGLMIFWPLVLTIYGREAYISSWPLMIAYSLFIACYNGIYLSVQYLISHNQHRIIYAIAPFLLLFITLVVLIIPRIENQVFGFILINLGVAFTTSSFLFLKIFTDKS